MLDLSIIILTWNSRQFIVNCLRSVERAVQGLKYELIVVDNGSRDGVLQLLADMFPQVLVIKNSKNRGVAPARNQGLAVARGRYIWLLDVDTRILDGNVKELIGFMNCNPQVGLAGCKLVYPDGLLQHSCRKFPTVPSKMLRRAPAQFLESWRAKEYYTLPAIVSPQEVDYVIGACQLIRRESLEQIGYLDDSIFYGPEDVDYCLRLWKAGWKVVYYPKISLVHFEQRITKKSLLTGTTWKHSAALLHYFTKHGYWLSRNKVYRQIATSQEPVLTRMAR